MTRKRGIYRKLTGFSKILYSRLTKENVENCKLVISQFWFIRTTSLFLHLLTHHKNFLFCHNHLPLSHPPRHSLSRRGFWGVGLDPHWSDKEPECLVYTYASVFQLQLFLERNLYLGGPAVQDCN